MNILNNLFNSVAQLLPFAFDQAWPFILIAGVIFGLRLAWEPFRTKDWPSLVIAFLIMGWVPAGIYIILVGNFLHSQWPQEWPASIATYIPVAWLVFIWLCCWIVRVDKDKRAGEVK
jgi:hypothetical protein